MNITIENAQMALTLISACKNGLQQAKYAKSNRCFGSEERSPKREVKDHVLYPLGTWRTQTCSCVAEHGSHCLRWLRSC